MPTPPTLPRPHPTLKGHYNHLYATFTYDGNAQTEKKHFQTGNAHEAVIWRANGLMKELE